MSLTISSNRRIVGNAAAGLVNKIASVGLAFITLGILVRGMGLSAYGEYIWLIAGIQLVFELTAFRLWETVKRFMPEMMRQETSSVGFIQFALLVVMGTSLAGLAITQIIAHSGLIEARGYDPVLVDAMFAMCLVYFLRRFKPIIFATFEVFNRFMLSNSLRIVLQATETIAAVWTFLIIADGDIRQFAHIVLMLDAVAISLLVIYFSRFLLRHLGMGMLQCLLSRGGDLGGRLREILGFSLNSSVVMVLRTFQNQTDILIIGLLASTEAVAVYNVAKKIGTTINFAISPMIDATFREFAVIKAGRERPGHSGVRRQVMLFVRYAALMGAAFWVALAIFLPLIASLLGVEHARIADAVWIIAAVMPIASLLGWVPPFVVTFYEPRWATYIMGFSVAVQAIALWQMVPGMAAEGGALAYTLFYSSWIMAYLFLMLVLKRRQSIQ